MSIEPVIIAGDSKLYNGGTIEEIPLFFVGTPTVAELIDYLSGMPLESTVEMECDHETGCCSSPIQTLNINRRL